jgi:hypothetical protein
MINGHPSAECIQRQVMGIDISEKNAVDIALGGLPTLKEDISMNLSPRYRIQPQPSFQCLIDGACFTPVNGTTPTTKMC